MSKYCTSCDSDMSKTGLEYIEKYDITWDDENNRFVKSTIATEHGARCKICDCYVDITWAER